MSNRLKLLREKATRPRRTVAVLLDGEVREQIEAVEDELDRLDEEVESPTSGRRLNSKSDTSRRDALQADLDQLRESVIESTLFLVLEGLPRTAFRALLAGHKPRVEDGKPVWSDRAGYNADTLPLPLVRACIIGYRERPETDAEVLPMPAEDVDALLEFATERQIDALSAAALDLCVGDDAVPLPRRRSANGKSASA